ncbi:MAG: triacylglycerol lipase [Pseudohongiellaceae bacterium]|jgi:triacylglycerol lipase
MKILKNKDNPLVKLIVFTILTIASAQASAGCWWWQDCSSYKTKYPIVLVHGVAGFSSILGIDYFYGVRNALRARGATVYAPNLTAWDDAYVRGEQLIDVLEDLKAGTGKSKFNLMGHSLGGPTIRYAAGVRPDLVASVTTINAVNFGSDFADVARGLVPVGGGLESLVEVALNLLGNVTDFLSGNPEYTNDALSSVTFMTSQGANQFNAAFPDGKPTSRCGEGASVVDGVRYYSWGGDKAFTNMFDVSDYFLAFTGSTINGANDGLVERCDQHWGDVISTRYNMNHLDAVNHIFGIHNIWETDPLTLYKNQAVRLKRRGL